MLGDTGSSRTIEGSESIDSAVRRRHSLRHTFVTWQLEDLDQPPSRVATLAGHESAEFTIARYVSGAKDDISDSLAALGWWSAAEGAGVAANSEIHHCP